LRVPVSRYRQSGFTLLEALAAVLILAILATLVATNYQSILARVQQAVCTSNMRSIHLALSTRLQDSGGVWPQGPSPETEQEWTLFWTTTLAPYGIGPKTWQCPTIRAEMRAQGATRAEWEQLHYVPTMFSAVKGIAYRWATQPWLIERANAHGHGALICFPDGSVKPFNKVLAEQGVR